MGFVLYQTVLLAQLNFQIYYQNLGSTAINKNHQLNLHSNFQSYK